MIQTDRNGQLCLVPGPGQPIPYTPVRGHRVPGHRQRAFPHVKHPAAQRQNSGAAMLPAQVLEGRAFEILEQDRALVQHCLEGDDGAWEKVVNLYGKLIYNLSFRFTNRRDEAEDLTQEIFIRAYQNLKSFRWQTGSFRNWILRVGRNLIIDHYRRERRFQNSIGSEEMEALNLKDERTPSPQRAAEQTEAARLLMEGLMSLAPEVKEAIILRDMEGMSYVEIAEAVGVPDGTIKSRVCRGRMQLAKILSRRHAARMPPLTVALQTT